MTGRLERKSYRMEAKWNSGFTARTTQLKSRPNIQNSNKHFTVHINRARHRAECLMWRISLIYCGVNSELLNFSEPWFLYLSRMGKIKILTVQICHEPSMRTWVCCRAQILLKCDSNGQSLLMDKEIKKLWGISICILYIHYGPSAWIFTLWKEL